MSRLAAAGATSRKSSASVPFPWSVSTANPPPASPLWYGPTTPAAKAIATAASTALPPRSSICSPASAAGG